MTVSDGPIYSTNLLDITLAIPKAATGGGVGYWIIVII
jgi:hypothetical protein